MSNETPDNPAPRVATAEEAAAFVARMAEIEAICERHRRLWSGAGERLISSQDITILDALAALRYYAAECERLQNEIKAIIAPVEVGGGVVAHLASRLAAAEARVKELEGPIAMTSDTPDKRSPTTEKQLLVSNGQLHLLQRWMYAYFDRHLTPRGLRNASRLEVLDLAIKLGCELPAEWRYYSAGTIMFVENRLQETTNDQ